MKEFFIQFFGEHSWQFHTAGLVFALLGSGLVKKHFWEKHRAQCEGVCRHPRFDPRFWIRDNWLNVVETLAVAFIFVRFSDILLHWNGIDQFKIGTWSIPTTGDTLFYYPFIAGAYQYWVHKRSRKKDG